MLPDVADLHQALGLTLIRKADYTAALSELAEAANLAPENARYAYVYGIGLHSTGDSRQALAILKAADARHPFNMDILNALISINFEVGNGKEALVFARKAAEAMPDNAEIQRLIEHLGDVDILKRIALPHGFIFSIKRQATYAMSSFQDHVESWYL